MPPLFTQTQYKQEDKHPFMQKYKTPVSYSQGREWLMSYKKAKRMMPLHALKKQFPEQMVKDFFSIGPQKPLRLPPRHGVAQSSTNITSPEATTSNMGSLLAIQENSLFDQNLKESSVD